MLTREEQVAFCKRCKLRKMDFKQGLVCSLTSQKADFQTDCPHFIEDPDVKEVVSIESDILNSGEDALRISPKVMEFLKEEQVVTAGILSGVLAGIAGAILWCVFALVTNFAISLLAILIGVGVGFVFSYIGKFVEKKYAIISAAISLLSVILGNFLIVIGIVAKSEGMGFFEVLGLVDFSYFPEIMISSFNVYDLLFYGVAAAAGYQFAFRKITKQKIKEIEQLLA